MMFYHRFLVLLLMIPALLTRGGSGIADDNAGRGPIAGPALMETTDTTPIEVRISGTLFVIPQNYFRYPPRRDGVDEDAFLLRVLLPDLEPYTTRRCRSLD